MSLAYPVCLETIAPTREEILHQLERILADRRFVSAERNSGFLRYVVESTVEGKGDEIKGVVVATEIYGRSTDYDPKSDSIVRVEATRLRSKLQSYYEQEGRDDHVRITIPKGTYVPRFERTSPSELVPERSDSPQQVENAAPTQHESEHQRLQRLSARTWLFTVVLAIVVCCGFLRNARSSPSHTSDPEALAAWQDGNELLRQDPHSSTSDHGAPTTLVRAIERYEFAVAKSPNFANAWASLAEAYEYGFAYVGRDRAEDLRRAELAARRAVALDGNLAYGHAMLALVLSYLKWDFAGAESEYRKAITMNPRNVYAIVEYADLLRETGRLEQAVHEIRKARALQPAIQVLAVKEAELQLAEQRPDTAIATAKAAVQLGQDYGRAHVVLGMGWEAKGDVEHALAEYRRALAINEYDRFALPAYGYLLATIGRREEAHSVLQRLEDMNARIRNCAFQVAIVYTGLGEQEQALDWFERAYGTRQMAVPLAAVEYRFRALQPHLRFQGVLKQIGLRTVA
jgi:tetratricopeptide (TPR) repeat protein